MIYIAGVELAEDSVNAIGEAFEQVVVLAVRHLFDREGLSLTASDVRHRLDAGGPARLTALAAAVQVSQPSMTELIKRLERRGLVARKQDPADRRVTLVAITDTAQAFMSRRQVVALARGLPPCWRQFPGKTKPRYALPYRWRHQSSCGSTTVLPAR